MNCENCGAKIPKGSMYCKKCGKDVQLVPDYNYLEEDILSTIIQEGAMESVLDEVPKTSSSKEKNKKRLKSKKILWMSLLLVCVLGIVVAYSVQMVKKNIIYEQANSYDYQYQTAEEYYHMQEYTNALKYYENALALRPDDFAAKERMLDIYLLTGDKAMAISFLEEKIEKNENDMEAWQTLIDIYVADEEYEKIQELAEQVRNMEVLELFDDYLVGEPRFSQISGTYTNALNIRISSVGNCEIYYTTDGTNPIEDGILYDEAIPVEEGNITIQAVAKNDKGIYSKVAKVEYTIRYEPPEMPVITPGGGTYDTAQMISIHVPKDCVAYYTWDGSEPTENSTRYSAPMEMPQGNQVLSVILVNSRGLKSRVNRINYIYMP